MNFNLKQKRLVITLRKKTQDEINMIKKFERTFNIYAKILWLLSNRSLKIMQKLKDETAEMLSVICENKQKSECFTYIEQYISLELNEFTIFDLILFTNRAGINIQMKRFGIINAIFFELYKPIHRDVYIENPICSQIDCNFEDSHKNKAIESSLEDIRYLFQIGKLTNIIFLENPRPQGRGDISEFLVKKRQKNIREMEENENDLLEIENQKLNKPTSQFQSDLASEKHEEIPFKESDLDDDRIEELFDIDGFVAITSVEFSKFLFYGPLKLKTLDSIGYKPRNKKIPCFDSTGFFYNSRLIHFLLGSYESPIGSIRICLLTKIKEIENKRAEVFLRNYNEFLHGFFNDRSSLFTSITESRPLSRQSVFHKRKRTNLFSDSQFDLLENEIPLFFDSFSENVFLQKNSVSIVLEVYGTKKFMVSSDIFWLYTKFDSIANICCCNFLIMDINYSIIPNENEIEKRVFYNQIPSIFGDDGQYYQFFSKKATNMNRKVEIIINGKLRLPKYSMWKINTYSTLYPSLVTTTMRRKKGLFLLQSILSSTIKKCVKKEENMISTEPDVLNDLKILRCQASKLGKHSFSYRNEISVDYLTSSVALNMIRNDILINQKKIMSVSLLTLKNNILNFIDEFLEISKINFSTLCKENIIKMAISEIIFHECFFKGSKNFHQIGNKDLKKFIFEELFSSSGIPVYSLKTIVDKAIEFFDKKEFKNIMNKIFSYHKYTGDSPEKRNLDIICEILYIEQLDIFINGILLDYFQSITEIMYTNKFWKDDRIVNAIHVDEWIYRFIDFCSNYNQVKSWKILIKFYFLLSIGIYEKIEIFGVIKNFISQFNIKKACLHENKKK